ncbi:MAG: hypothetical protein Q4C25_07215, partial [Bacillota bacterium]|nr:hypothetical protein [Bacillota bacterium]
SKVFEAFNTFWHKGGLQKVIVVIAGVMVIVGVSSIVNLFSNDDEELYEDMPVEKVVLGEYEWPTMGPATLIDKPESDRGKIEVESASQFFAYIGDTNREQFDAYIKKCIEKGFDVDYSKSDNTYHAENADNYSLHLTFETDNPAIDEKNVMSISMYAPDDAELDGSVNESEKSGENAGELVDGMRLEFKAAMDSYEEFFNEYCNFMKKYNNSSDQSGMMSDYTDMLTQYTDTMTKMNEWENKDLNDAELKYYTEVTGRIAKNLAKVSI